MTKISNETVLDISFGRKKYGRIKRKKSMKERSKTND